MLTKIERATAMRQPAHDHFVARNYLLPVNAQVLPRLVRPARDCETPGDEWPGVTRPAGLHRQARQIDRCAVPNNLLARCIRDKFRRHVEHLFQYRPFIPCVLETTGRLWFLEKREQLAHFAQAQQRLGIGHAIFTHARRNAAHRAEQIGEHRHSKRMRAIDRLFKQQGRPAGAQNTVANFGHFEPRCDRKKHSF